MGTDDPEHLTEHLSSSVEKCVGRKEGKEAKVLQVVKIKSA